MQLKAFEAALRLIGLSPADQPLMRILSIAVGAAGCSSGLIGVRWPDRFQIIVSVGMPLADFRPELERSDALAKLLHDPVLIADAREEPAFAGHPHVTGDANWRFIASVPLRFVHLPLDIVMMCMDGRTDVIRRDNLLNCLDECAAIASDELRLISDIALQSEKIAEIRATSAIRMNGVRDAGIPMALVAADGRIALANDRLLATVGRPTGTWPPIHIGDLFPGNAQLVMDRLHTLLVTQSGADSLLVHGHESDRIYGVDLMRVVSSDAENPLTLCTITDRSRILSQADEAARPSSEPVQVVADFLLDTLITRQRLLKRGAVTFHALRRWRASVKQSQLAALKALKRHRSADFIERVADEMAATASTLFGRQTFSIVVSVPCGNSGPGCFSHLLADAVARRLGLPHVSAFADLPRTGGSHPRGITRRPAMSLIQPLDAPVLLIDDVATSGAHLAEAARLLLASGAPAVLPLAWLADA